MLGQVPDWASTTKFYQKVSHMTQLLPSVAAPHSISLTLT